MRTYIIIVSILFLASCKKEKNYPSDGPVSYSDIISVNSYEFITGYQTQYVDNHTGPASVATPSGQGWKPFKTYMSFIDKQFGGDPFMAIVEIWIRQYSISGGIKTYTVPTISSPDDSHIYSVNCGDSASDTLISKCIPNIPISTYGKIQYYPYAGKSLYWKP